MTALGPRALLTAALSVAALAAPAGAAEVQRSPEAIGVGINGLTDPNGRLRPVAEQHARLMRDAGIRLGRTDAFWPWVEPSAPLLGLRGYTWTRFDDLAAMLARHEIRWLPVLGYSTLWSTSVPDTDHAPPLNDADYVAYAEAFARRYGRGGSFWAARPDLAPLPVTTYQIWNEPNLGHFWRPEPDARHYARLFAATRDAIKRADPEATVVMAGLWPHDPGFVREVQAARPDLRGSVDVFAYHPYAPSAERVFRLVRRMRATLDASGEERTPLWITELGWPTRGRGGLPQALPDRTRAGNLALATDALLGANCGIGKITAYTWLTPELDEDHDEQWLGIYHPDGRPTEAGLAYGESIRRNADAAAAPPARALRVCEGAHRGGPFAKPLKLGIGLRAAGRRCHEATVTYRGRPLNDVAVLFDWGRGRSAARTNLAGVARRCLPAVAAGRKLRTSARMLDVAASRTAVLRVR